MKSLRARAVRGKRQHYRRSVTALTLIAGFASTVFWPLTNWLEHCVGWRMTFGAFGMFAVAILVLAFAGHSFWWAVVFAVLFGASNGVMTIVRGTAPAELFGQQQLGSLLGRLARPAFAAKAITPVIFAALVAYGISADWAQAGLAVLAILGLLSFAVAVRAADRR